MSFERSYKEQFITRRIPLHYRRRYLANISNGSFNATFLTGLYKNKIKSLLKNNQLLALALQNDRLKKEELLAESKSNADLIMFSKLKLSSMSENLKKAVSALDETLSMLQRHSSEGLKKFTPKNTVNREEFKDQLRDVLMEPIIEETEPPQPCEDILENVASQIAVIHTNKQALPAPDVSNPSTNEICHSLKSKTSDRNLLTRSSRQKCVNKLNNEVSKQMFVKNSPLKEVCAGPKCKKEKNLKNPLLDEFNMETAIVFNEANQHEINSSKTLNTSSEKKELHLNSKVKRKTIFRESNLAKSIGINKRKKNKEKSVKTIEHIDPKIKAKEIGIDNFPYNFAKRVLRKNSKTKTSKNKNAHIDLINEDTNAENEDMLCSNSAYSAPKMSNDLLEEFQNFNAENHLGENFTANNCNEVNSVALRLKKLGSCEKINQHEVKQDTKASHIRKRPLKCLASEMNIENVVNEKRQKPKASKIDDLTLDMPLKSKDLSSFPYKRKSYKYLITDTVPLITNNYGNNENTPPLSKKDLKTHCPLPKLEVNFDYHQGVEMVKNLASSTYLVTAEVHKQPDNLQSGKEVKCQKIDSSPSLQPVVCLTDIFKAGKSLCKSISVSADRGKDRVPLEVQLLQHCSSLKLLTSEASDAQNVNSLNIDSGLGSSVDQKDNEGNSCKMPTTSLTSDITGKRQFRKRPSDLCYKEPSTNIKLRR